ncbi:tubulin epsilon and delta complex protein 2 [Notechis scutatus]|uniref:Tubulin epsilon and delta complex protein 2 n=1 Tax=Notechis scutatus TaxID=8663 RepID=A0A6J1UZT3_9SAUR|nr:tubulin epsilon and delta complex protein 2 [Notechis scutatus]
MLPADCAQRLVSLFTQALEDCTEQRTKLQQKIQQCRAVLGEWSSERESPVPEDAKTEKHEATEPSAEELKDLELLNKALEKALRLRSKFHQVPCETIKVSETSSKKPASQSALGQPARNLKGKVPKTTEMSPVSRKPVASKKPTAYMLKAPYKTDAVVKRPPVKIPAGRSKTAGKKLGSSVGVASPKWKPCAKTAKDPDGKVRVAAEPGLPLGCSKGPCHTTTPPRFAGGGDCEGTGLQAPDLVDPDLEALGGPYALRTNPPRKGAKPPTSTLQQIGSSLKLPLPYQKAFSKYVRLLEKCQDLKTDPEAAVAKSQFLEKLQATALGENPTWDREYESLVTVQALQEVVEQHLGKLDQMREALVSHAEFASLCTNDKDDTDHDSLGFCHAPLGGRTCSDPDSLGPPRLLFYSSLDELKEMEALKWQVAMLDQKLQIQAAMETELLPLLEPGRLPESSRPSAIRAVYSLMCESEEHVPVLVKDEEVSC